MPILFAILGKRAGLDMSLAVAPRHMFVRFTDEAGRAWNLETTSGGGYTRDSHYRRQLPMTDKAVASGLYLRTLSQHESLSEIASFGVESLMRQQRYEEVIVLSYVILKHHPKALYAMIARGSAYGMILRRDILGRYRSWEEMPPHEQELAQMLSEENYGLLQRLKLWAGLRMTASRLGTRHSDKCKRGAEKMTARWTISSHVAAAFLIAIATLITLASPASARFLSPDNWDPWLAGVDINRYAYSGNDPINLSDPNGHAPIQDLFMSQEDADLQNSENYLDAEIRASEVNERLGPYSEVSEESEADQHRDRIGLTRGWRMFIDGVTYGTLGTGKGIGAVLPRSKTLGRFLDLKEVPGVGLFGIFKGHHLHSKKAFEGIVDPNNMISFSDAFLKANKLNHSLISGLQNKYYTALKKAGVTPTMRDHTRIAVKVLVDAGYDPAKARQAVGLSLRALRQQGVSNTTKTHHPWNKDNK